MPHPVYPFNALLRALRKEAGLTVVAAGEATGYWNYERWESGQTRVAPQHVGAIASAFRVTDELWLLLYAWLVDRFTPDRGQGSVDLAHANVSKSQRWLPADPVDLGEYKDLILEPGRHLDLAMLALIGRNWSRQRVVLVPTPRSPLPVPESDESLLSAAYGDVYVDMLRFTGRTIFSLAKKNDQLLTLASLAKNLAPMLSSPTALHRLAAEMQGPLADDVRQASDAVARFRDQLAQLIEAATAAPANEGLVDELATDVFASGPDRVFRLLIAAMKRGTLPPLGPEPFNDMKAATTRIEERAEQELRLELAAQLTHLDTVDLVDALNAIAAN